MPQNKKESLIFGLMACGGMVLGMSSYNLWLHQQFSINNLVIGFFPGFIVAFLVENFFVGNLARKIAFSFSIVNKSAVHRMVMISICMILGMVTVMSFYGVMMQGGLGHFTIVNYLNTFAKNLLAALPLQLLIVGPVSRKILTNLQRKAAVNATSE